MVALDNGHPQESLAAIYKTLCDILNCEKLSGTFLTVEL